MTDNDWINQVALESGLPLAGGPLPDTLTQQMMSSLQAQMPTIWAIAGAWSARVPAGYQVTIRFLIAKQRAVAVLMGQLRGRKDQMVGRVLRVQWSQVFRALKEIYQLTSADLKVEWAQAVKG